MTTTDGTRRELDGSFKSTKKRAKDAASAATARDSQRRRLNRQKINKCRHCNNTVPLHHVNSPTVSWEHNRTKASQCKRSIFALKSSKTDEAGSSDSEHRGKIKIFSVNTVQVYICVPSSCLTESSLQAAASVGLLFPQQPNSCEVNTLRQGHMHTAAALCRSVRCLTDSFIDFWWIVQVDDKRLHVFSGVDANDSPLRRGRLYREHKG